MCGRQGVSGAMIGFTWEVVLGLHISGCVGGRTFLVRCWVSIWRWAWVDERVGIKIVSVDRWLLGEMVRVWVGGAEVKINLFWVDRWFLIFS